MLNRAGDAERKVQLRRDGLPGAAHLAFHRQPPGVADGARRRDFGAQRLGQLLRDRDVRLLLDAASDRHDALGLRQIHGLLRLLERRLRLLADRRRINLHFERPDGGRRCAPGDLVHAERADLKRHEMGRRSLRHDVGGEPALKHRPHECGLPARALDRGDVGDEGAVHARGELGREVARLVRVRQQHMRRREPRDRVLQRRREAVRRIGFERGAFEGDDLLHRGRGELRGRAAGARARHEHSDWSTDLQRELLRADDGFPCRAIELAVALFGDDQNHLHRPLARKPLK